MFGCNALAPYIDRTLVEQHIARLKPATLLIMGDNPADPSPFYWARDLKQKYPTCTVIYRQYDARDQNWDGFSAAQIWDIHRPYAVDGLVVQIWNEPNGYQPLDKLISRAVQICQYARQEGKRVGLPTWGIGHPDDARVDAGELDPLLRELAADKRDAPNLYLVHEYANDSTLNERPYHIGRFQRAVARSQAIGALLAYRRIAVTEYGRDFAGNAATDGWRVKFNNDETAFFNFMLPGIEFYKQLGVLGADVFCCGKTWASFDYQHAETLKGDMEAWNVANPVPAPQPPQPTPPETLTPLGAYKLTKIPGSYVNVRVAPRTDAPDVGDLHLGDVVTRYSPDSNGWTYVSANNTEGWVSLQNGAVVFTAMVTPPNPVWTVKLDVPFVSQIDSTSAASNNDCGPASLAMLIRHEIKAHTGIAATLPTVDEMVRHTALAQPNPPNGLTFAQIDQLSRALGYATEVRAPLPLADILRYIGVDWQPVMVLVDYSVFNPGAAKIAHLCVVKGYSDTHVLCADPYLRGDNYAIPRSQLEAAMANTPGNSPMPQGLVLAL